MLVANRIFAILKSIRFIDTYYTNLNENYAPSTRARFPISSVEQIPHSADAAGPVLLANNPRLMVFFFCKLK